MQATTFDYVIVGAGSAGCALANRLSACGKHKVLLLEAGGSDRRFWIRVPVGYAMNFANPRVNWNYRTDPDSGLNGRRCHWPRGRVIGGSSSINAMAYVRGMPHDFDDWETAGATGWGWQTVRPTYDRLESHSEIVPGGGRRHRGNGPVRVSDLADQMHPFSERFLTAAQDLGWSRLDDLNGSQQGGLGYYRSTVHNGQRWSAADAFLRPALRNPNLALIKNALVERVLIRDGRAIGLRYREGGALHEALAGKEVILSAGAINSPQILQVSGIGPAGLLRSHGIEVACDLSQVGQGLQDHLALTHHFSATEPTLNAALGRPVSRLLSGLRYLATRRGPLAVPVNQVGGFVPSDANRPAPDMQVFCNPVSYTASDSGAPEVDPDPGFLLSVQPCRPSSRGAVQICSADPCEPPAIQPNSLATETDQQAACAAGRVLRRLAGTPSLAAVTRAPKDRRFNQTDDAALLEDFRARASTVYHPSCTCRMGRDATDSVLDSRLRVHGMRGLRVVDASAFPNITSGNINAPTIMLAARAAELILQDG